MRRIILVLVVLGVAAAAGWAYLASRSPASSFDGKPQRYALRIDPQNKLAKVEADIWVGSDLLSLFNVSPVPGLAQGQADLLENLKVLNEQGEEQSLSDLGLGDFEFRGHGRYRLSYEVKLTHDQYAWPAGMEEVGYWTDEGVMLTGNSLFLADGGDKMQGPIEVHVAMPEGWSAYTPWTKSAHPNQFIAASRRELLSNAMFFGTASGAQIEAGGLSLDLVVGKRYQPSLPLFETLIRRQLAAYQGLFGAPPRSQRYLIIVNEHPSGDGGAFASSFSQLIDGDADQQNQIVWGYTMAHELLHFWNGLSITPQDDREEWFKEGATDYLTIVTLAQNGFLDRELLFKRLENVPRRYLMARMLQGLNISIREAGKNKQPNRLLVYGGGSLAALALDVELRLRSQDRVGLPALMRALHSEFGQTGKPYRYEDLVRIAGELSQSDFAPWFARAVDGTDFFDIRPSYRELGLRMDSFVEEMFISQDAAASERQRTRFAAVFGQADQARSSGSSALLRRPGWDGAVDESAPDTVGEQSADQ